MLREDASATSDLGWNANVFIDVFLSNKLSEASEQTDHNLKNCRNIAPDSWFSQVELK